MIEDNEAGENRGQNRGQNWDADAQVLRALRRFRQLMGRLLLLMLGMVGLGFVGLNRGAAVWAVEAVFAGAALTALAMLMSPLAMAWKVRKRG